MVNFKLSINDTIMSISIFLLDQSFMANVRQRYLNFFPAESFFSKSLSFRILINVTLPTGSAFLCHHSVFQLEIVENTGIRTIPFQLQHRTEVHGNVHPCCNECQTSGTLARREFESLRFRS